MVDQGTIRPRNPNDECVYDRGWVAMYRDKSGSCYLLGEHWLEGLVNGYGMSVEEARAFNAENFTHDDAAALGANPPNGPIDDPGCRKRFNPSFMVRSTPTAVLAWLSRCRQHAAGVLKSQPTVGPGDTDRSGQ